MDSEPGDQERAPLSDDLGLGCCNCSPPRGPLRPAMHQALAPPRSHSHRRPRFVRPRSRTMPLRSVRLPWRGSTLTRRGGSGPPDPGAMGSPPLVIPGPRCKDLLTARTPHRSPRQTSASGKPWIGGIMTTRPSTRPSAKLPRLSRPLRRSGGSRAGGVGAWIGMSSRPCLLATGGIVLGLLLVQQPGAAGVQDRLPAPAPRPMARRHCAPHHERHRSLEHLGRGPRLPAGWLHGPVRRHGHRSAGHLRTAGACVGWAAQGGEFSTSLEACTVTATTGLSHARPDGHPPVVVHAQPDDVHGDRGRELRLDPCPAQRVGRLPLRHAEQPRPRRRNRRSSWTRTPALIGKARPQASPSPADRG